MQVHAKKRQIRKQHRDLGFAMSYSAVADLVLGGKLGGRLVRPSRTKSAEKVWRLSCSLL